MNSKAANTSPAGTPAKSKRLVKLLLVLLVLVIVGAGVGWYRLIGRYKWSEPYKAVLAAVKKNSDVTGALGLPVTDATFMPTGDLTDTKAKFWLKVRGPKGEATVEADMMKLGGKWVGQHVVVKAGGKEIPVEVGDASDDAPKFGPGPIAGPGKIDAGFPSAPGDGGKTPAKPVSPAVPAGKGDEIDIDVPDLPDVPTNSAKPSPKK